MLLLSALLSCLYTLPSNCLEIKSPHAFSHDGVLRIENIQFYFPRALALFLIPPLIFRFSACGLPLVFPFRSVRRARAREYEKKVNRFDAKMRCNNARVKKHINNIVLFHKSHYASSRKMNRAISIYFALYFSGNIDVDIMQRHCTRIWSSRIVRALLMAPLYIVGKPQQRENVVIARRRSISTITRTYNTYIYRTYIYIKPSV